MLSPDWEVRGEIGGLPSTFNIPGLRFSFSPEGTLGALVRELFVSANGAALARSLVHVTIFVFSSVALRSLVPVCVEEGGDNQDPTHQGAPFSEHQPSTYMHTNTHHYHTNTHIHTCTYTHAHTHMHIHTCTYTHAHTHMHIHAYTHAHIHIHMHTYTCTHTHAHIHMHTYSYVYTHTPPLKIFLCLFRGLLLSVLGFS